MQNKKAQELIQLHVNLKSIPGHQAEKKRTKNNMFTTIRKNSKMASSFQTGGVALRIASTKYKGDERIREAENQQKHNIYGESQQNRIGTVCKEITEV